MPWRQSIEYQHSLASRFASLGSMIVRRLQHRWKRLLIFSVSFRGQLQKNVVSNGGEYTGDLTKEVTHLIAAKAEGKKYEYATLWQKKVVSLQWYKDTLDRGMQLDETKYHPSRPALEQGIGAWNRHEKPQPTAGKRTRDEPPVQEPTRKLRRVASARLGSQTDFMWGDIVGQTVREAGTIKDDLRPMKSMPDLVDNKQTQDKASMVDQPSMNTRGFLSGLTFAIWNFEGKKEALLLQTLQAADAVICDSVTQLLNRSQTDSNPVYVIVPYQTQRSEMSFLKDVAVAPLIVTELWLERCMRQKDFIPPSQYPLGGLVQQIDASDMNLFTINATGFQPIETLHIAKTVNLTGATYAEVFTAKSSVLICNSLNINRQKLFHAKQWGVPAVSEGWLCRFLMDGSIPKFDDYLVEGGEDQDNNLEVELEQRRNGRHRRQSPDVNGRKSGSEKPSFQGASTSSDSTSHINTTPTDSSSHEKKRTQSQDQTRNNRHKAVGLSEDTALREISPNSPSGIHKRASSPMKKSLFRTYKEVTRTGENHFQQQQDQGSKSTPSKKTYQDAASVNSAIEDLLNMKAKAKANLSAQQNEGKSKRQKLLGRALSNLSNASHGSRKSRASSIDSLNTDGVGSEIAPLSRRSTTIDNSKESRPDSLQSQMHSKTTSTTLTDSMYQTARIDFSEPHLLNNEFDTEEIRPQMMTQLGYEDSEEAVALREKLAAKRQARAKLGQREGDPSPEIDGREREAAARQRQKQQVIKDDDTLTASGWGGGRRTRAKNKSVEMKDLGMF